MMKLKIKYTFLFSLIILLSIIPVSVFSQKGYIRDVSIKPSNGGFKVSFFVEECFTEKIEEAIKTGIPTTFNFFLRVYQKRWWKDKEIANIEFSHVIQFDPVRGEYHVKLGENHNSYNTPNLEEAKKLMATVREVEIRPYIKIPRGTPTELRIKAELDPVKLPFPLQYIFFLTSLWDFKTDWHIESISF